MSLCLKDGAGGEENKLVLVKLKEDIEVVSRDVQNPEDKKRRL